MKRTTLLYFVLWLMSFGLCLTSCKNSGRTLPSATGTIYECLVVCDNGLWQGQAGELLKGSLAADMPCMPQIEPMLTISQVPVSAFDNLLAPTRNILFIDLNPNRYTHTKLVKTENAYSQPQAFARLQTQSEDSLVAYLQQHVDEITQYFISEEIRRQGLFYRGGTNHEAREAVQHRFEADILIPSDFMLVRDTTDFVWAVNDKGAMRRDIVIYSYPYTDSNTFTYNYLLQKRDDIMRANIEGGIAGSYMGTEYNQIPPIMKEINLRGKYCAEIRGLWKMYNGAAMGGAFVQHTRLDEINQRVITAEVFLYAPGQKKRNAYRQAEAILYTLKLAEELALPEVNSENEK